MTRHQVDSDKSIDKRGEEFISLLRSEFYRKSPATCLMIVAMYKLN